MILPLTVISFPNPTLTSSSGPHHSPHIQRRRSCPYIILGFPRAHPTYVTSLLISPIFSVQFQLPSDNHPNPSPLSLSLILSPAHAPPPPADLRPNLPSPPLSSRKKQKQRNFSLSEVFCRTGGVASKRTF